MQKYSFPDGGFVCHDITHVTKAGKVSAWYDKYGTLLDCEFIDSLNRARPIPETWEEVRRRLASIGGAYSV